MARVQKGLERGFCGATVRAAANSQSSPFRCSQIIRPHLGDAGFRFTQKRDARNACIDGLSHADPPGWAYSLVVTPAGLRVLRWDGGRVALVIGAKSARQRIHMPPTPANRGI
jgi:hypothetical protein